MVSEALKLGTIRRAIENDMFRVQLDDGGEVTAHLGAELRRITVRLIPGDRVEVVVSTFDTSRGKIVGKTSEPR